MLMSYERLSVAKGASKFTNKKISVHKGFESLF
jgi:hypothetical protein